jgi:predicted PurR-regulated permease PerM
VPAPQPEPSSAPSVDAVASTHAATTALVGTPAEVPFGLRVAAAWSWRVLLVAGAVALIGWLLVSLSVVVVPVLVGLLISALVYRLVDRLTAVGLPRAAATLVVVVGTLLLIAGVIAFVSQQVAAGFADLSDQVNRSIGQLQDWLASIGISQRQLESALEELRKEFTSGGSNISQGVLSVTTTAGHVLAGFFIVLFTTYFFCYDGPRIWSWVVGWLPAAAERQTRGMGAAAWASLASYTRATVLVALVDALGIGLVALVLGLPLVAPITVLVFLASFVPIVGATVSGLVAVAVALVAKGPLAAVLMLAGILAVQQLEAHGLQPFVMGRLVRVHPLAIVLVIAIGSFVAGIVGALFAVPAAAVLNAVRGYVRAERAAVAPPPPATSPPTPSPPPATSP